MGMRILLYTINMLFKRNAHFHIYPVEYCQAIFSLQDTEYVTPLCLCR